jgi:hypothetical protein
MEGVEDEHTVGDGEVVLGKASIRCFWRRQYSKIMEAPWRSCRNSLSRWIALLALLAEKRSRAREPEFSGGLITRQDHVGDVLVDGGMEDVENGVVRGGLGGGGLGFDGCTVEVANESSATKGGLHVDGPLGVVPGGEGEDDGSSVTWGTGRKEGTGGGRDHRTVIRLKRI